MGGRWLAEQIYLRRLASPSPRLQRIIVEQSFYGS